MQDNLTIILPTYNNHHFTLRFLKYFNNQRYRFNLIIADYSKKKIDKNVNLELKKNKKIIYVNLYNKYKSEDVLKRYSYILNFIKTPFVKVMANDDFFINYTLMKCIKFLKKNKKYDIAGGYMIDFQLKNNLNGKIYSMNQIYKLKSNDSESIKQRINQFTQAMHDTSIFVCRTKMFKNTIKKSSKIFNNDREFREIYVDISNISHGKMKMFKDPIALHQIHNTNDGAKRTGIIETLSDKNFLKKLIILDTQLNKTLKIKEKINFSQILFENFFSSEIIKHKKKYYYGIKDILKLSNNLIKLRLKKHYLDNYVAFLKDIKNNVIKKEIGSIQNFLLSIK